MRILRFIYDWPPPWDGLAPGPFALTRAQAKLDNQVIVISGGGSLLGKRRDKADIPNVRVVRLARTLPKVGPFFTTAPLVLLAYFYYKIRFCPNVIHGHGHITLWFNLYQFFFGWLSKTPYVLHFHNTAAGREAKVIEQGNKVPILTSLIEWPLHKLSDYLGCLVADKLIFVSEETAAEARRYYGAPLSKIVVLENGVDFSQFSSNTLVERVFKGGQTLMYQGYLKTRKRINLLIKALNFLPASVNLVLIGPSEEAITNLVKSEGLHNRVKLLGYLRNDKTPPYFRGADLFVIPSSYEGFPKAALEALACGLPVLASGFSVDPPVSGLTIESFETAEDLAKAIKGCLDKPQKVDVKSIEKRFDWSVLAKRLQKIYEDLG